jgi:hypothetical protein
MIESERKARGREKVKLYDHRRFNLENEQEIEAGKKGN